MKLGGANRHDHTNWLIHFVRGRSRSQDELPEDLPDPLAYEIEPDAGAFQVLKTVVRLGGLVPGYSLRKGRTTIYGGRPAVCVTEMPLYSFAMYVRERAAKGGASAYGVAFLKSEFFKAGGRPAIYGLASDNAGYVINDPTNRILKDEFLPQQEQFRYVAYDPSRKTSPLDWSHEREWRWIPRDEERDQVWAHGDEGLGPAPALPLLKGRLEGGNFSELRLIVWSQEEADEINELLTGFHLSGGNNYDTPFDKRLIRRSRIIVLEKVIHQVEQGGDFDAQTIEGLDAANLLDPVTFAPPPAEADKTIDEAFAEAERAAAEAGDQYRESHPPGRDAFGRAQTFTYEVTHPLVQMMIKIGHAYGPFDGKVIARINGAPSVGEITHVEKMHEAASEALTRELGARFFSEAELD